MSLYGDWTARAQQERTEQETQRFWNDYFALETEAYRKVLARWEEPYAGTLSALAAEFGMDEAEFSGFVDGANTSFAAGEFDLEQLTPDTELVLAFDFDKLYKAVSNVKSNEASQNMEQVLGSAVFTLPHSPELEAQVLAGNLFADLSLKDSRGFRREIEKIAKEVFEI